VVDPVRMILRVEDRGGVLRAPARDDGLVRACARARRVRIEVQKNPGRLMLRGDVSEDHCSVSDTLGLSEEVPALPWIISAVEPGVMESWCSLPRSASIWVAFHSTACET
jgi:hypothetical protein